MTALRRSRVEAARRALEACGGDRAAAAAAAGVSRRSLYNWFPQVPEGALAARTAAEEAEWEAFAAALETCRGVASKAAAALGVDVKTVYNRMRRYAASPDRAARIEAACSGVESAVGACSRCGEGRHNRRTCRGTKKSTDDAKLTDRRAAKTAVVTAEEAEWRTFLDAFDTCDGVKTRTAVALGMSVTCVYKRLKRYGAKPARAARLGAVSRRAAEARRLREEATRKRRLEQLGDALVALETRRAEVGATARRAAVDCAAALAAVAAGATVSEVASALGWDVSRVRRLLAAVGVKLEPGRRRGQTEPSAERSRAAVQMLRDGARPAEVARALGISHQRAAQLRQRYVDLSRTEDGDANKGVHQGAARGETRGQTVLGARAGR